jgi:hypothetical protein
MMNSILEMLAGGDLRSDGMGDEVADLVLKNPHLFDDLLDGLKDSDDVIRGRASHALEMVSRHEPELLKSHIPWIINCANNDNLAMTRWHLAMIFGNLALYENFADMMFECLLDLIMDRRAFVISWAIVSLCIFGRLYPKTVRESLKVISPLQKDRSIAIRSKAGKAVNLLTNETSPFPAGWIKSPHIRALSLFGGKDCDEIE